MIRFKKISTLRSRPKSAAVFSSEKIFADMY